MISILTSGNKFKKIHLKKKRTFNSASRERLKSKMKHKRGMKRNLQEKIKYFLIRWEEYIKEEVLALQRNDKRCSKWLGFGPCYVLVYISSINEKLWEQSYRSTFDVDEKVQRAVENENLCNKSGRRT